jgi:hypothetical protein
MVRIFLKGADLETTPDGLKPGAPSSEREQISVFA